MSKLSRERRPKIYTRKGDGGETSLLGGRRVSKADLRVEAYGTVDEAGAAIAIGRAMAKCPWVKKVCSEVQDHIRLVASELASGGEYELKEKIEPGHIARLEEVIDRAMESVPPVRKFVKAGEVASEAALDLARTIVRRAERLVVRLGGKEVVRSEIVAYLNRLSDALFALARVEANEELVRLVIERVRQEMNEVAERARFTRLSLEAARELAEAGEEKARSIGVPMVIAVADASGELILLHRMDGALPASVDIAAGKAYTAAALKMETQDLSSLASPGGPLFGINTTNRGRIVLFGGGVPLKIGSEVVGGVGVSGGAVEMDVEVARAASRRWASLVKEGD